MFDRFGGDFEYCLNNFEFENDFLYDFETFKK